MINNIIPLLNKMNVTGAEQELADFLYNRFKSDSFDISMDLINNVIIKNPNSKKIKNVVCCPIDNPGFLTLYLENQTAFVTRTEQNKNEKEIVKTLQDANGNVFECKKSKKYPDYLKISSENVKLGQAFRYKTELIQTEEKLIGKFASRYALIDILSSLTNLVKTEDIAICFTSGFHSLGKSENIIANKLKPENLILLGFSEENEEGVLLFVKDGKSFSDKNLVIKAKNISEIQQISLEIKASDKAITKAESIAVSGGINTLSLALPCKKQGIDDESICLKDAKQLIILLTELLKA